MGITEELFKPKHKGNAVWLQWCAMVGLMQSGKSTNVKRIIELVNNRYGDYNPQSYYLYYLESLTALDRRTVNRMKQSQLINLVVDDAGWGASSKKYKHETTAIWFYIRHIFEEYGITGCTINVFFLIQRFMNLQNIMRNSPVLYLKAMLARDKRERQHLNNLSWGHTSKLQFWANKLYLEGDNSYAGKALLMRMRHRPHELYIRLPKEEPEIITLDTPNKSLKQQNNEEPKTHKCLKCKHEWNCKQKSKYKQCPKCMSRKTSKILGAEN